MIGHYLLTLTPDQEDRVLTTPMVGFIPAGAMQLNDKCLLMAVHPDMGVVAALFHGFRGDRTTDLFTRRNCTAKCYDWLCERFGNERVNAAIRNRILSNQARRTLRQTEPVETVGA